MHLEDIVSKFGSDYKVEEYKYGYFVLFKDVKLSKYTGNLSFDLNRYWKSVIGITYEVTVEEADIQGVTWIYVNDDFAKTEAVAKDLIKFFDAEYGDHELRKTTYVWKDVRGNEIKLSAALETRIEVSMHP